MTCLALGAVPIACGQHIGEVIDLDTDYGTESGPGGESSDSTESSTGGSTTVGPETSGDTTDDGTTGVPDLPPLDEPPTICALTLNGQASGITVTSPQKLAVEICAQDDLGLKHAELLFDGETWHEFDFTAEDEVKNFSRQLQLPIFSLAQNSQHDIELLVTDQSDQDAEPVSRQLTIALPDVDDPNAVEPVWRHEYLGPNNEPIPSEYFDVAVDAKGDVYAVGYWLSDMEENIRHALVVKIPGNGNGVQTCAADSFFMAPGVTRSEARGVAVTSSGDVVVVGSYESSQPGLQQHMWARRFDEHCNMDDTWLVNGAGADHSAALDVALDDDDNVYVVGFKGILGLSSSYLVHKYELGFSTPKATLIDLPIWLKYHVANDVIYDPKRELLFITGAQSSAPGFLDQDMMLMAVSTNLDAPAHVMTYAPEEPYWHSEGFGVRVRADGTLLVVGDRRISEATARGMVWRYDYNDDGFYEFNDPISLVNYSPAGDEKATAVDVTLEVPFFGQNEWAVSIYALLDTGQDGSTPSHGYAEKRRMNDTKHWEYSPQPISRFQSVAISCTGYVHVAGHWKTESPPEHPQAIVHKLPKAG